MTELYLIGTVHIDPDGSNNLKELLKYLKPEAIAIEMHEQGARTIEERYAKRNETKSDPKKREELLSRAQKEGYNAETIELFLSLDIAMNYEYLVPKIYCEPKGVPLYLVDEPGRTTKTFMEDSTSSLQLEEGYITGFEHIEEALRMSPQELRQYVNEYYSYQNMEDMHHAEFENIRQELAEEEKRELTEEELRMILNAKDTMKIDQTNHLVRSDEHVEQHLRKLCKSHERLVYVGGAAHIFLLYPFGEQNLSERISDLQPVRLRLCDTGDIISHPKKYNIPFIST